MNKEQIEEIDELTTVLYEANHKKSVLDYRWLAIEAFCAGFRKRRVGFLKNIADFGNGNCFGYCSVCGTEHKGSSAIALKINQKYCRWCGAYLKGGAE